jgi:hypothetical protein
MFLFLIFKYKVKLPNGLSSDISAWLFSCKVNEIKIIQLEIYFLHRNLTHIPSLK